MFPGTANAILGGAAKHKPQLYQEVQYDIQVPLASIFVYVEDLDHKLMFLLTACEHSVGFLLELVGGPYLQAYFVIFYSAGRICSKCNKHLPHFIDVKSDSIEVNPACAK